MKTKLLGLLPAICLFGLPHDLAAAPVLTVAAASLAGVGWAVLVAMLIALLGAAVGYLVARLHGTTSQEGVKKLPDAQYDNLRRALETSYGKALKEHFNSGGRKPAEEVAETLLQAHEFHLGKIEQAWQQTVRDVDTNVKTKIDKWNDLNERLHGDLQKKFANEIAVLTAVPDLVGDALGKYQEKADQGLAGQWESYQKELRSLKMSHETELAAIKQEQTERVAKAERELATKLAASESERDEAIAHAQRLETEHEAEREEANKAALNLVREASEGLERELAAVLPEAVREAFAEAHAGIGNETTDRLAFLADNRLRTIVYECLALDAVAHRPTPDARAKEALLNQVWRYLEALDSLVYDSFKDDPQALAVVREKLTPLLNSTLTNGILKIDWPVVGDTYAETIHKSTTSLTTGKVQEVLSARLRDANGKVIRKASVALAAQ